LPCPRNPRSARSPSERSAVSNKRQAAATDVRRLQSLAPEHAAFIERLQPYHDPNPTTTVLYALNVLSNVDKHREMHFAYSSLMGASLSIRMAGGGTGLGGYGLVFGQFTDGSEVARIYGVVTDASGEPPRFEVGIEGAFDLGRTTMTTKSLSTQDCSRRASSSEI
jgi:hypothetical protein